MANINTGTSTPQSSRIRGLLALVLALSPFNPVHAQTTAEASALNMQLGVELCLRNYQTVEQLPLLFTGAGFTLAPSNDAGVYAVSAPGISGHISANSNAGYCSFQTGDFPIATAEAIGNGLAERWFPGLVEFGSPERQFNAPLQPCEGLSIFAPRNLIRITYAQAGNSGECVNDGTSAIIIVM